MIHETWLKAPSIEIDPCCTRLHLEKPLRIGSFASIGFPGFSYNREKTWIPKPHPFGVRILEDASLHSHVTIDRGSWRDTFIGKNARINNYAHIGHNVKIGHNVLIGVGAIIAGSAEVGDSVCIWNGAKIRDHRKIGAHAVIGMGAVVLTDVEPHAVMIGNPARKFEK